MSRRTLGVSVAFVWLGMFLALSVVARACPPGPAPELPGDGKGLWRKKDCTWEVIRCPSPTEFQEETRAVRLPWGCIAPPRITYSEAEDNAIRGELSESFMRVTLLTDEVARGRKAFADALAISGAHGEALERRTSEAEDKRDKAVGHALQLQNELVYWKIGSVLGGVGALVVGGVVGGLIGYAYGH